MINWVDKDATGIVKFPDFLYMMASKVQRNKQWCSVHKLKCKNLRMQMDSDLEEIDIREAFTIFDNVSLIKFDFTVRQPDLGWERSDHQDWAETCHDEHGRKTVGGRMRLPGWCESQYRVLDVELNCQLYKEADTDGDGSINFEEFVNMMKSAGHYSKVDGSWQWLETGDQVHQVTDWEDDI